MKKYFLRIAICILAFTALNAVVTYLLDDLKVLGREGVLATLSFLACCFFRLIQCPSLLLCALFWQFIGEPASPRIFMFIFSSVSGIFYGSIFHLIMYLSTKSNLESNKFQEDTVASAPDPQK